MTSVKQFHSSKKQSISVTGTNTKTIGIQSEKPLLVRPPFRGGQIPEETQVFLSTHSYDVKPIKKDNKSLAPSSISNISKNTKKTKKSIQSDSKKNIKTQSTTKSKSGSVTSEKTIISHKNNQTIFDASKLLRHPNSSNQYNLDFDSRWEYFLELKTLDEATRRIYISAFFQIWKSLYRRSYLARVNSQASQIEETLDTFNATHRYNSYLSNKTHALTDRSASRQYNQSYISPTSSHTSNDLPRGYSYSSINNSSEARINERLQRYRSNKYKDLMSNDQNNNNSYLNGSFNNYSSPKVNYSYFSDDSSFNKPATRAYVSESVSKMPIKKVKKIKHNRDTIATKVSLPNELIEQIDGTISDDNQRKLVKDVASQLTKIANFNTSLLHNNSDIIEEEEYNEIEQPENPPRNKNANVDFEELNNSDDLMDMSERNHFIRNHHSSPSIRNPNRNSSIQAGDSHNSKISNEKPLSSNYQRDYNSRPSRQPFNDSNNQNIQQSTQRMVDTRNAQNQNQYNRHKESENSQINKSNSWHHRSNQEIHTKQNRVGQRSADIINNMATKRNRQNIHPDEVENSGQKIRQQHSSFSDNKGNANHEINGRTVLMKIGEQSRQSHAPTALKQDNRQLHENINEDQSHLGFTNSPIDIGRSHSSIGFNDINEVSTPIDISNVQFYHISQANQSDLQNTEKPSLADSGFDDNDLYEARRMKSSQLSNWMINQCNSEKEEEEDNSDQTIDENSLGSLSDDNSIYKDQMMNIEQEEKVDIPQRNYKLYLMPEEDYNKMEKESVFHSILSSPFPNDLLSDVFTNGSERREDYLMTSTLTPLITYLTQEEKKSIEDRKPLFNFPIHPSDDDSVHEEM